MSASPHAVGGHGQGGPPVATPPARWSNEFLGVAFFLCSELVLFSSLIFAYLYLKRVSPVWPPAGEDRLEIGYPFINTIILISSGVTQHLAHGAIRRGQQTRYLVLLAVTIVLGSAFIGGQIYEYHGLHTALNRDTFGGTFFTLTGLHGAHVTGGILFLIWVFIRSLRGKYNRYHHFAVEAGTLYWHFVDAIWVVLFALFYLL